MGNITILPGIVQKFETSEGTFTKLPGIVQQFQHNRDTHTIFPGIVQQFDLDGIINVLTGEPFVDYYNKVILPAYRSYYGDAASGPIPEGVMDQFGYMIHRDYDSVEGSTVVNVSLADDIDYDIAYVSLYGEVGDDIYSIVGNGGAGGVATDNPERFSTIQILLQNGNKLMVSGGAFEGTGEYILSKEKRSNGTYKYILTKQ